MRINDMKSSDWNKTASEYSQFAIQGPLLYPCKRLLAAMDTASSFSSATGILDVGCGPGTAVTLLAEGYGKHVAPEARIIASDFSQAMIDAAQSRKESMVAAAGKDVGNCWSRLETLVMDAQHLSAIESNSLSHVMGSLVYFMLPDPKKGLLEANRVLKEGGGVFACTSWTTTMDWMRFVFQAAVRVKPELASVSVKDVMPKQWTNTEGVKSELEAAGFHDVHSEYVEFEWHLDDPQKHANMIVRSKNPGTQRLLQDMTEAELDKCCEEYMKIAEENGNVCKGIAVLGIGRK